MITFLIIMYFLSVLIVLVRLLSNVRLHVQGVLVREPPTPRECVETAACILCPFLNTAMAVIVLHDEWAYWCAVRGFRKERELS